MIFLTVGTIFPFDRLVRAVDEAFSLSEISVDIIAQVGKGGYKAKNFKSIEILDEKQYEICFQKADAIIAHAGMGTITMALQCNKPILVMPRLKKYRELVNNHQIAAARHFERLGHIIVAYNKNELSDKLKLLQNFKPIPRGNEAERVSIRIGDFLNAKKKL